MERIVTPQAQSRGKKLQNPPKESVELSSVEEARHVHTNKEARRASRVAMDKRLL